MRRAALICLSVALAVAVGAPAAGSSPPLDADSAVAVSGSVTDATSGSGIGGVFVQVQPAGDEGSGFEDMATTNADGSFAFSLKPGRYLVRYSPDWEAPYATQYWPLRHTMGSAKVLRVRAGAPVEDIDAELVIGATVTGRAYEESTGEPIGTDGCLRIAPKGAEDEYLGGGQVSADGRWSVDRLPPTEVTVRLERCDNWHRFTYAYGAIDPADATTFTLSPGATTSVGRIDLIRGATITGTVTSHQTGEPIEGAAVRATPLSREGGPGAFATRTDSDGHFVIEDAQPGTWYPSAAVWPEWGEKWEYGLSWRDGATDPRRAEPLVLESGGSAVADFQLRPSARIVIKVEEPYGEYLTPDAYVRLAPGERWRQVAGMGDFWKSPTKVIIDGLPSTRVDLRFAGEDGIFWFDGVRNEADATHVRAKAGKTVRVKAHLPDDWSVAGE